MSKIKKIKVGKGIFWVEIPEAQVYVLCGCPDDSVKHLMRQGFIAKTEQDGVSYETGPNAILLSDVLLQNGRFSNLAEFPVLQMLYRQGMIIPNHPNNRGIKPLLIGSKEQVSSQMEYIYRGNYGLISKEEIIDTGINPEVAEDLMRMKLKFAFGKIKNTQELIDTRVIENSSTTEIRNGVFVKRLSLNVFEFKYKDDSIVVDLNLANNETYEAPYPLGFYNIKRDYFGVIHSGEGDGWDINNPCMASILMFQGKIYLIDAGPDILYSLIALGIGIDEIEGIFHTHSHDDHFAGLPTLMRSDHKIKYYSTPLVRNSVAKKLSALLSIEEESFYDYFEVHDLDFNIWNKIDGLEVKPLLSPHPVETAIYIFRTMTKDGYSTYGHFSDIVSFEVLEGMITEDENEIGVSKKFYEDVKKSYLTKVDLKKIDIGGGLIHGVAEDFKRDRSKKIVLAHTSFELTDKQKEVGSGSPFGIVDTLIPAYQDYAWKYAYNFLRSYFSEVDVYQLYILLNNAVVTFNPKSIILKEGEFNRNIYLILTGNVEMIQSKLGVESMLSSGAMVGEMSGLLGTPIMETYRAVGFVQALEIPCNLYLEFVRQNNLYSDIKELEEKQNFLQKTWLFSEALSYLVQNQIAKDMRFEKFKANTLFADDKNRDLYMVKRGKLQRLIGKDVLEELKEGDFFGEGYAIFNTPSISRIKAITDVELYKISTKVLCGIPAVRWKLFETYEKRKKFLLGFELKDEKKLKWSEDYNINIQKIDNQHKKLFEAGNILFKTINFTDETFAQRDALNYFISCVKFHFDIEDSLLSMYNHPAYKDSRSKNRDFLKNLIQKQKDFTNEEVKLDESFMDCVIDWINEHILIDNKEQGKFLNDKGVF